LRDHGQIRSAPNGCAPQTAFSGRFSFLREEGVTETLKKGTRVTGADRTKLASDLQKRYSAGESIRALAASTGRSYGFIHRILAESGVALRGRGGATRGRAKG
jgi:helix-turn-helix protein